MAAFEPDFADAPACPLLGLVVDRDTRFTFPHPGHRCYGARQFPTLRPKTIEPTYQASYCLSADFVACGRYRIWEISHKQDQRPGEHAQPEAEAAAVWRGSPPDALWSSTIEHHAAKTGSAPAAAQETPPKDPWVPSLSPRVWGVPAPDILADNEATAPGQRRSTLIQAAVVIVILLILGAVGFAFAYVMSIVP